MLWLTELVIVVWTAGFGFGWWVHIWWAARRVRIFWKNIQRERERARMAEEIPRGPKSGDGWS
jgi:hypothetical protein